VTAPCNNIASSQGSIQNSQNSLIGQTQQQGNSCVNGAGCTVQGTQAASITGSSNGQINQKSTGTNTCSGTDTSCNINNSQNAQIKDISNAKIDQQLLAMFSAAEIALVAAVVVHRLGSATPRFLTLLTLMYGAITINPSIESLYL
jgi:hypothetical protein